MYNRRELKSSKK